MKKIITFLLLFQTCLLFSQNQWAWMAGDNIPVSSNPNFGTGTIGTIGVAAPANTPPAIIIGALSWTDKLGNFWMCTGDGGFGSNMWKFDPLISQWMQVKSFNAGGSMWLQANLGLWTSTFGIPINAFQNLTHYCWVDTSGVFWAATNITSSNAALFKYDPRPTSVNYNQWSCARVYPANTISYGVKGVSSPTNSPGNRGESVATWTDKNNNLWLYGGQDPLGAGDLGDLWKYNIASNEWTWMSGSNVANPPAVFGVKGVPSAANQPGGLWTYVRWVDNNNDLWLQTNGPLWRYSTSTNEWVWETGTAAYNTPSVVGPTCVENSTNVPGWESGEARTTYKDDCGNLWFYGNSGRLWKFRPSTRQWTVVSDLPVRNAGAKGVFAAVNSMGINTDYDAGFYQSGNGIWVFEGSSGTGGKPSYNNMWLYKTDKPTVAYTTSTGACPNGTVLFNNTSLVNCGDVKKVKWNFGDPASGIMDTTSNISPTHQYNASGTYNVKLVVTSCIGVKDSLTQAVNVVVTTPWTLAAVSDSSKCNVNNGKLTLTLTGAVGNYNYVWSNGINSTTTATTYTETNLAPGNYIVTITDGAACTSIIPVTIPKFSSPKVTVSTVQPAMVCYGDVSIGTISTSVTGNGGFSYLWNTGATSTGLVNMPAGGYAVTITDANGCTQTGGSPVNANTFAPWTIASQTLTNSTSCTSSNGRILVRFNQFFQTGFTYTLSNGSPNMGVNNAGDFQNLPAGTYTVTVTNTVGCTSTVSYTLTGPSVSIASLSIPSISCNGGNGNATVTGVSGTSPYTYSWSSGATATTTSLTNTQNLPANNYTVTFTDANGCSATSTATITQPSTISLTASQNTAASCGISNGVAITTLATGGTGVFNYTWSSGATGLTANNLAATTYTVTATDANNCTKTSSATISNATGPSVSAVTGTNPLCNSGSGTAFANASGGTGALTYTWNTGQTSATATGFANGTYTVTVKDLNNCSVISTVSIIVPSAITLTASQNTAAACGNNNGIAITTAATGGTGSFNYAWSSGATGLTASTLTAGTYVVTAADANNCTGTSTATITNSTGPVINNITAAPLSCSYSTNGTALANASGSGILTYQWSGSGGATGITGTNLSAGTNYLTVTDGAGCVSIQSFTVTAPSAISTTTVSITNAVCGLNTGTAVVSATGGTAPLNYNWSSATGATIINQAAGSYIVTVTDLNLCSNTLSVSIGSTAGASISSVNTTSVTCNAGNGSALVNIVGGVSGNYTYSWIAGQSATTSSSNYLITSLLANSYTVTVIDGACSTTTVVTIIEPSTIIFSVPTTTVATCGVSNGAAVISASGGTGALNYLWSTTAIGQTITAQPAGNYFVTVTDLNNCTRTASVLINNNPSAILNPPVITNAKCNGQNSGGASVSATGSGTLTYSWNNSISGQTISNVLAGNYIISVTDGNGCLTQSAVLITEPAIITAQSITPVNATCGNSNGSASIIAIGGTAPLNYSWSVSGGVSGQTIQNQPAGTFVVTVTDLNLCTKTLSATIGSSGGASISSVNITNAPCKAGTGSATITIAGGVSNNYTYTWSSGANTITSSTSNLELLTSNTYTVTVIDGSCTAITVVTITEPASVFTGTVTSTNATCTTPGSAIATISGGNIGNFTYTWSNNTISTTTSPNHTITSLLANTYTVTITDSKGCSTISTTTVNGSTLPTVTAIQLTQTNCTISNGVALATATGTSGYTYIWSSSTTGATASNLSAGNYTVTLTDINGCTATSIVTITTLNGVNVSAQSSAGTCAGKTDGTASVTITASTGPYKYTWSNGQSGTTSSLNHTIISLPSSTYTLTVTDGNNCTVTTTVAVPQFPSPIANAGSDQTINNGTSIQLVGSGGINYLWTPALTLSNAGISNPIAKPTITTTYVVVVTDANSCTATDNVKITVVEIINCNSEVYLPTAFSPNNDGQNDVLYVRGNQSCIKEVLLFVFDRWGEKVFETAKLGSGWDGTFMGKQMDTGVYVYQLTADLLSGERISTGGNVTLLR